jgi:organic radical activating enzyme
MKKCAWVENMVSIETDGWTRPCCGETDNAARISPIQNGIKTAFNHPKLLTLRENLNSTGYTADTEYACYRCRQVEEHGQQSLRTGTKFISEQREIRAIQFKMSNKCQLTCAHCGPERSSGWRKLLGISPHVINAFDVTDEFLAELVELLPNLDHIKFTGGEPFLDPAHYKILEHLSNYDRSHCKLVYITNGLIKPRLDLWKGWASVQCSISIEGYKDTYEWFRRDASWDELLDSVDIIKNNSNASISYSVTPWTIADYPKTVEFWKLPVHTFPIVYPKHAGLNLFPRHIAEQYWDKNLPYFNLTTDKLKSIDLYKKWAVDWDNKWHTQGQAEKLYAWLK